MNKEQAIKILENMPEDIYKLDGISPAEIESWSLTRLHKQFIYKGNNQNISIDCIVDWREGTFNLVHVIHKPKQELPSIYSKIGEKMIAYFTLFGLKRDFYL
jgi:hypothetical protein